MAARPRRFHLQIAGSLAVINLALSGDSGEPSGDTGQPFRRGDRRLSADYGDETDGTSGIQEWSQGERYTLLEAGLTCHDVGLADVASATECFSSSKSYVGLGNASSEDLSHAQLPFSCVFRSAASTVFFSTSVGVATEASSALRFLCVGVLTTTGTGTTSDTRSSTATSTSTAASSTISITTTTQGEGYTLLEAGLTCHDVGLADVASATECFTTAKRYVGLTGANSADFSHAQLTFSCVFQSAISAVFFSTSAGAATEASSALRFLCAGVLTTTGTSTSTGSATTATSDTSTSTTASTGTAASSTTSVTTTTQGERYTLLEAGLTCHDVGLADVASATECFSSSKSYVGLGSAMLKDLSFAQLPFSCVFRSAASTVLFSTSVGAATEASSALRFLCVGVLTTNGTGTSTATVTVTTTTATTDTAGLTPAQRALAPGSTSTATSSMISITTTTEGEKYTLLETGLTCHDVGLEDVASATECFSSAMSYVGLDNASTQDLSFAQLTFSCVFQSAVSALFFSTAAGAASEASSTLRFLCVGVLTTTGTSTSTGTVTVTTTTATTDTSISTTSSSSTFATTTISVTTTTEAERYTLLDAGLACHDVGLADVASATECFSSAKSYVGLGGASTEDFSFAQLPFSCVFQGAITAVFFSSAVGAATEASSALRFICVGVLTTTGTSTSTDTSSVTVTTATTVTSTSNTSSTSTFASSTISVTTTTEAERYTLLDAGLTCHDVGLEDVASATECFSSAKSYAGLDNASTQDLSFAQLTFSCVFQSAISSVFFSTSVGAATEASSTLRFLCVGILTTTGTSTSTTVTGKIASCFVDDASEGNSGCQAFVMKKQMNYYKMSLDAPTPPEWTLKFNANVTSMESYGFLVAFKSVRMMKGTKLRNDVLCKPGTGWHEWKLVVSFDSANLTCDGNQVESVPMTEGFVVPTSCEIIIGARTNAACRREWYGAEMEISDMVLFEGTAA